MNKGKRQSLSLLIMVLGITCAMPVSVQAASLGGKASGMMCAAYDLVPRRVKAGTSMAAVAACALAGTYLYRHFGLLGAIRDKYELHNVVMGERTEDRVGVWLRRKSLYPKNIVGNRIGCMCDLGEAIKLHTIDFQGVSYDAGDAIGAKVSSETLEKLENLGFVERNEQALIDEIHAEREALMKDMSELEYFLAYTQRARAVTTASPVAEDATVSPAVAATMVSPVAADTPSSGAAADTTASPVAEGATVSPAVAATTVSPVAADTPSSGAAAVATDSPAAVDLQHSEPAADTTVSPVAADTPSSGAAAVATDSPAAKGARRMFDKVKSLAAIGATKMYSASTYVLDTIAPSFDAIIKSVAGDKISDSAQWDSALDSRVRAKCKTTLRHMITLNSSFGEAAELYWTLRLQDECLKVLEVELNHLDNIKQEILNADYVQKLEKQLQDKNKPLSVAVARRR